MTLKEQVKELKKLHIAILKIGSSHAWFFLQQAYDKKGLLSYTEMVDKIKAMIVGKEEG